MSHIIDVHILVYYTEQSGMVVCHPGRNLNSGTALLRGGRGASTRAQLSYRLDIETHAILAIGTKHSNKERHCQLTSGSDEGGLFFPFSSGPLFSGRKIFI
jgi:hypothetical protein